MANLSAWQKPSWVIPAKDFGDGSAGNATISSDPNTRTSATATSGGQSATLGSAVLSNGDTFVIYQTTGTGAGNWEFNKVSTGGGSTSITCSQPFQNTYGTGAQVIKFIQYNTATISSHSPVSWGGTSGGIEVIVCLTLAGSGTISRNGGNGSTGTSGNPAGGTGGYRGGAADAVNEDNQGQGFQGEGGPGTGSASSSANGGGGGASRFTDGGGAAGAGGGYGTAGSNSGKGNAATGTGGSSVGTTDLTTIFFGGGGAGGAANSSQGAGGGGAGGGAIIIFAKTWSSTSPITVNGGNGGEQVNSGAGSGGNGAGGAVLIVTLNGGNIGSSIITSLGSIAGSHGGGNGGNGRIAVHHKGTVSGTTNPTFTDVTDNTLADGQPIFATANIEPKTSSSAKASIVVIGNTDSLSAKAMIPTHFDSVSAKAYIPTHQVGIFARANIRTLSSKKTYEYHIYNANNYVTTWSRDVISEPKWRTVINGGPSELLVTLARKFDNFGESNDVSLNNRVDLWVFDRNNNNGTRIYRGYISGYRPILEGNKETLEITVLSYVAELSGYMHRNADGTTLVTYENKDPSDILKAVIDRYRIEGGFISYSATSIAQTGNLVNYVFNSNTVKECIDIIITLCPVGWYWVVQPDGFIYLQPMPTTTTHNWRVGREVAHLETWRRAENIVNRVYFTGGGAPQMYRTYSNSGSITSFGLRIYKLVDQNVTNTGTADIIANRYLNAHIDPEIRTTVDVNDHNGPTPQRGYDIDSVFVGQTIQIGNLAQGVKTNTLWDIAFWDTDVWDETLSYLSTASVQIQSIDYTPQAIKVEASSRPPEIARRLEEISTQAQTIVLVNNPSAPTVVS